MSQSFPEYASEHADFIDQLAHATSAMLREAFDHAWTTLSQTGALADFGRLCNELDALEADAEARNEAGRPSKDVYRCAMLRLRQLRCVRASSCLDAFCFLLIADRDQSEHQPRARNVLAHPAHARGRDPRPPLVPPGGPSRARCGLPDPRSARRTSTISPCASSSAPVWPSVSSASSGPLSPISMLYVPTPACVQLTSQTQAALESVDLSALAPPDPHAVALLQRNGLIDATD